jgi:hypothetical protein
MENTRLANNMNELKLNALKYDEVLKSNAALVS